jgi:pimeloyl-ACP methyl ester carboxylesterase
LKQILLHVSTRQKQRDEFARHSLVMGSAFCLEAMDEERGRSMVEVPTQLERRTGRHALRRSLAATPAHIVCRSMLAIACLLLGAILIYLTIGSYIALQLTAPDPTPERASLIAYSLAFQSPAITTKDGVALASWFIPRGDSDRAIVMVHGLWTCRSCEFDGHYLELANSLHSAGYNILMIDLRKHGESGGDHITFGDKERWDVLAAVDWLHRRGFTRIGVLGASLGAVSAIEAAAEPQEGQQIRALVLDSPFADLPQTLENAFTMETHLPDQLLPGAMLMMRVWLGVDLYSIRPSEELPKVHVPVMLIYGLQDKYISVSQMESMEKARPDAQVWVVSDAGHTRIYNAHEQEYVLRVTQFLDKALR